MMVHRASTPTRLEWLLTRCLALLGLMIFTGTVLAERPSAEFFQNNCYDCHQGEGAEGGLDFEKLPLDLSHHDDEARWVRIFDRINTGEMPPPDYNQLDAETTEPLLSDLSQWINRHQREKYAKSGRVQGRRLTRRELSRTLHDMLGIDIPLLEFLPEEAKGAEFSTVAEGQSISHFDVDRHLAVVDIALDEAYRRAFTPEDKYEQRFDAKTISRKNPKQRNRDPELREGQAVIWSSGLIYYGRTSITTAPEDGWYRFKLQISGLKLPKSGGVWTTVNTGLCVSSAPLLTWVTSFEAMAEPKVVEFEAWLPKRHMLEIRPGDTTLKKGRFRGGQVGVGEGEDQGLPGIAMDWMTMERIHKGPSDDEIRRMLFGDLEFHEINQGKALELKADKVSPEQVDQLMVTFASRAFRRPVEKSEIEPYRELVHAALADGEKVSEALRIGYRALLCSPRFMYFTEPLGELDSYAIANRLSYLLTGSMPDEELTGLAAEGKLKDAQVIDTQVERLLAGKNGRRFLEDFAAEWLDLNQIDATEPERRLAPDFDKTVERAMLDETHQYLETMLRENQSVRRLMISDDTYLNSRLARYYGIEGVEGDELRQVSLKPEDRRGGLITQGAIMKVTANGSTTSPVLRGVWMLEKIMGIHVPPPPVDVAAVEPDIRGSKTVRDLLAKHRADASCASCHTKIDPPGFALENYDPAGKWRDRYFKVVGNKREKGPEIDPAYVLPDGRPFADITEFQALVAEQPEKLAKNMAEKLIVYGTGAPVAFADRAELDRIVDRTAEEDYGFRSIIRAVAVSPLFLTK
ncbi:MAG: DUF1592 domain-containing protein [Pirellulaceae bacterium]